MVFVFHYVGVTRQYTQGNSLWEGFEAFSLMIGSVGTNLLLMLSGFLIAKSLSRPEFSYWKFLQSRSLRIFVPYVAIVSLGAIFALVFPAFAKSHPGQSAGAYYLQQLLLFPGLFPKHPFLTVSWTLSIIYAAYCVVPLIAIAWGKERGRLRLWVAALVGCLAVNLLSGAPTIRICYIAAGCILAELVLSDLAVLTGASSILRTLGLGLAFLALRFTLESVWRGPGGFSEMQRLLFFACGLGAVSSFAILSIYSTVILRIDLTVWPLSGLNFIGRRGYSFYLLHASLTKLLVMVCVSNLPGFLNDWTHSAGLMVLCLLLSSFASDLSFQVLEVRGPALVSKWLGFLVSRQPTVSLARAAGR